MRPLPTMNPELKAKWLEALRSGRYAQAKGRLRENNAFCCLGVLCEVAAPQGWNSVSAEDGEEMFFHLWGDADAELLDGRTLRQIGLTDDLQHRLANMNDEGKPFDEIALVIEAEA